MTVGEQPQVIKSGERDRYIPTLVFNNSCQLILAISLKTAAGIL